MIPLSEQYRINIKNAIELIDNTLELVEKSNVILTSKHLKDVRKEIAKNHTKSYPNDFYMTIIPFEISH